MSSTSTVPQSAALTATPSPISTAELPSSTSWTTSTPTALMTQGMPASPLTPLHGPPGMPPPALLPMPYNLPGSALPTSSIPGTMLPPVPAAPNVALHPQFGASYPPLNSMASPPQGIWLQPPKMSARPPFVPYPSLFPGPLPFLSHGIPLPSVPLPDPQPPGVTPVREPSVAPLSSAHHQQPGISGMQANELPPPGTEYQKSLHATGISESCRVYEQAYPWTAHSTETGTTYYYNALTGESTYNKPSGFQSKPDKVSMEATPASVLTLCADWVSVTTGEGKTYYYNSKTKVSCWQIPSEVTELRKKQDGRPLKEPSLLPNNNSLTERISTTSSLNTPAINSDGRDAIALRPSLAGTSSALDLIKKKLQDSGAPVSSPISTPVTNIPDVISSKALDTVSKGLLSDSNKDKPKDVNHDGSKDNLKDPNLNGDTSDDSSDSEDVDNGPTNEECIIQFKEMLKERGVAPFSKWDKELPKIVFDPRFKAIPSHSARRSLFEHYVKTRAEEERKEKRAAHKAATEGFKNLLEEALKENDQISDYHSFKKKYGSDPRFEALERKDRENLLNERIFSLKKIAEEKAKALRDASNYNFKSMLREREDINVNSRWSKVKDSLRIDQRYTSVRHEDREVLFNEYISELKAVGLEAEQEMIAKRQEQDKLKEREREWRKRKEREEQEMERVRLKVRRKEAVASFQALLMETIKDPQASWTESKSKIEKDPQGRGANPGLDSSDAEKLFREHIKMLQERCAHEFRALLSEVLSVEAAEGVAEDGKSVFNSWSTAKRILKPDPRYTKVSRKDRESLWRRFSDDLLRKLKSAEDRKREKQSESKKTSTKIQ